MKTNNKTINLNNVKNQKFLRIEEVSMYLGLGRCTCRKLMDAIGATVHIGSRVVFDKKIIDNYFDNQTYKNDLEQWRTHG